MELQLFVAEIAKIHNIKIRNITFVDIVIFTNGKESRKESRLSKVFPAEVTIFHTKKIIRELKEIASIFFPSR